MRPLLAVAAAGALAALAGAALAAPLGLAPGRIGAGATSVVPCDDAVTHAYTTARGRVATVVVGGLADPACEGGLVRVTIVDAAGSALAAAGPVAVPIDSDTADASVSLVPSPQPLASEVARLDVVVEGP